jgi:hypothetical protein
MQTSIPLLYSPYEQLPPVGPVLKIKLVPVRTLVRFTVIKVKKEFRIKQYLTVYSAMFIALGLLVSVCLLLLQLT